MATEVIPKLTYEQFRELPDDGKRYELIHGEVHFTPSPTTKHQFVQMTLSASLFYYLSRNRLGEVATAPLDVRLDLDTALQPDIVFISNSRAKVIQEKFISGAPDLVVEILSPSTAAHDRATKLALYGEAGVSEVWLVDPQAKTVEILKLQGGKYLVDAAPSGDRKLASTQFPGWELPLNDLLRSPRALLAGTQTRSTMKKPTTRRRPSRDEIRQEYQFDYRKSRPNRFASRMKGGTVEIVLDPDVASVFRSPESVNSLLRSVIKALPKSAKA